jgi:O-antigen ligase
MVAALAGSVMWMRNRGHTYNAFHWMAMFCVISALVSALASANAQTSLLKVLSLFLLFLYGATGARLAMLARESQFLRGLLIACEIAVYASAVSYLGLGLQLWGNPNSLGAVMGVVIVPLLFWGVMVAGTPGQRYRRLLALLIAATLLYVSLSRASILAAAVAVSILCISLRRQRILLQGVMAAVLFLSGAAVLNPLHFGNFVESVTSEVLYKGKPEQGLLGSRLSPWQEATKVIRERPWFGTGFGTSFMGEYAEQTSLSASTSSLSTKPGTNREHGNSYLALIEYVGILGILPFAILVFLVGRMVFQVFSWMRRTSDPPLRDSSGYGVAGRTGPCLL